MNQYRVEYKGKDIQPEDEIDYGIYTASSPINAIEQIIKQDTTRTIYDLKTELFTRHWGMVATLITMEPEPVTLSQLQQLQQDSLLVQKKFLDLEKLYDAAITELAVYKESSLYGATFKYYEYDDVFIPVMGPIQNVHFGLEKPYKFTLNFDQKILAHWLTECQIATEPEEEDET